MAALVKRRGRARLWAFAAASAAVGGAILLSIACGTFHADTSLEGDAASAGDGSVDAAVPACAAELGSDGKNCGRCGHDCLGAACSGGLCAPTIFVKDLLTDSAPVCTDTGPLTPCERVVGVAADDARVAWTLANNVRYAAAVQSCSKPDCKDMVTHAFGPGIVNAYSVALRSPSVYWTEHGLLGYPSNYDGAYGTRIADSPDACALGGQWTGEASRCKLFTGPGFPEAVAAPAGAGLLVGGIDGVTYCLPGVACTPGEKTSSVVAIASGPLGVFIATRDSIARCTNVPSCTTLEPVAVPVKNLRGLAVDDTSLYFSATPEGPAAEGAVLRCTGTACQAAQPLASGIPALGGVAVDATYVYFASKSEGGAIYRVPK